jgi:hypothetical protein
MNASADTGKARARAIATSATTSDSGQVAFGRGVRYDLGLGSGPSATTSDSGQVPSYGIGMVPVRGVPALLT